MAPSSRRFTSFSPHFYIQRQARPRNFLSAALLNRQSMPDFLPGSPAQRSRVCFGVPPCPVGERNCSHRAATTSTRARPVTMFAAISVIISP